MPDIREVDPHDERGFRAWHTALAEGATDGRTAPLIAAYEPMAYSLRNPGPVLRRIPAAAIVGNETIGALLLELPLKENLDTAMVEIDVPPKHRRRGVATALWDWASQRGADEQRSVFQAEVNVPLGETVEGWPGAVFASHLGFTSENVEDHLVVPLPYDVARLATLESTAADGYQLMSWAGTCPEEHLETYADLQSAMSRDVPTGGMTREAVMPDVDRARKRDERMAESYLSLVTLATSAREPAGYTQIFVPKSDRKNVMQDDTLVLSAHRGHNLGTALKVANMRQLAQHHSGVGWLHTWTAESNVAMQRVNARFGFRAVEKTHELERRSTSRSGHDEAS